MLLPNIFQGNIFFKIYMLCKLLMFKNEEVKHSEGSKALSLLFRHRPVLKVEPPQRVTLLSPTPSK